MVEIIGLVTIGALVWLLAWSMAGESESEHRRRILTEPTVQPPQTAAAPSIIKQAA